VTVSFHYFVDLILSHNNAAKKRRKRKLTTRMWKTRRMRMSPRKS
jgi:hypothetical protein